MSDGLDINIELELSKFTKVTPLELALIKDRLDVVQLLVEQGAKLNTPVKAERICV
ncbi:ankyrin repeat domain-containing protein [Paenibacillus sp. FSL L8-0340]|uniref:ankyrin repeat domain-containing protein n=1 Tax=Paenibacillus sp. FSL L8-0340 TaxID=2954685 RepID=UPI003158C857